MEISCCLCLEGTRIILDDDEGDDPNSTHKCCQGLVHIKRACFYVGVSALVLCLFTTICMFFGVYSVNLWLDIVLIVINTVVAIVLLIGLYYDRASYMVPFIVSEVAQCVLFFILANWTLFHTFTSKKKQRPYLKFDQLLMVLSIYLGIFVCASAVWVATKTYHFLKQKQQDGLCDENNHSMWR